MMIEQLLAISLTALIRLHESIACMPMFSFPEKMEVEAPRTREIIEKELLCK